MPSTWTGQPARPEPSDRRLPQGILLGLGAVAVIAAGFAASAVPAQHPVARYSVLAVTIFVFTAVTRVWAAAAGVAVIGYLIFNGFLVNQLGELSWHANTDLTRAGALVAAVVFGRLAGDCWRLYRLFAAAHAERRAAVPGPRVSSPEFKEDMHDA